ncbi:MAG: hypothetical protein Q7T01_04165 [bacterium]|nr:hypothetical protein [bacterium]
MASEERKQLMVRGDRLLFALDVLEAMILGRGDSRLRFSRHRILAVVDEYIPQEDGLFTRVPDFWLQLCRRYDAEIAPIHRFLYANAQRIQDTTFDAGGLLATLRVHVAEGMMDGVERLFVSIASGKLTEVYFTEVQ